MYRFFRSIAHAGDTPSLQQLQMELAREYDQRPLWPGGLSRADMRFLEKLRNGEAGVTLASLNEDAGPKLPSAPSVPGNLPSASSSEPETGLTPRDSSQSQHSALTSRGGTSFVSEDLKRQRRLLLKSKKRDNENLEQVAVRAHVSLSALYGAARGDETHCGADTVAGILRRLGISPAEWDGLKDSA